MQEMTPEICANSSENETKQLEDTRDGKDYWVTKLAGGNCWMTQNLDLGSTSEITLDSDDTNLAVGTTYTLPAASSLSVAFTGESKNLLERLNVGNKAYATPVLDPDQPVVPGGDAPGPTPDDPPAPSMDPAGVVDHGEVYIIGSNTYSALDSCKNAVGGDNAEEVCEHSTIGNHYDWSVATAGSGDSMYTDYTNAPYSICPKGWRLPTAYDDSYSALGDFTKLNNAYGGNTSNDNTLRATPLFFVRAGNVLTGSLYNVGSYGYYWSSTVNDSRNAYELNFLSSLVFPASRGRRVNGSSVRCVAGS